MKENETKTQNIEKQDSKGMRVLKGIFNVIINVLIVVVLITSLLIAVMSLTSRANGISTIFGYTIQPIQSDSMKGGSPDGYEGGDFGQGDLMIAKATNSDPDAEYDLGDIVTYTTEDIYGNEILMAHRIVDAVKNSNGEYVYQTWGDNRQMSMVPDQNSVEEYLHSSEIVSLYYSSDYQGTIIKGLGAPLDYIRTQQGFFMVVLLPMIIFFMYALVRVVLGAVNYKKSKAEEEKEAAVKEAVAAATAGQPAPENMTPEQMEQFRQFMEFQKQQNASKESDTTPPESED